MGSLLAIALLAPSARATVLVCEPRRESPGKPLMSVVVATPLYVFDRAGRFYRGNFRDDKRQLISDHGFVAEPHAMRSPDGRWIAYSGVLKANGAVQYWLFDKQETTDLLLLERPKGLWSDERFSPDGKRIAIFVYPEIRSAPAKGTGLYIVDVASARTTVYGYPGDAPIEQGSTFWSRDGGQVLVYLRATRAAGDTSEYYRLSLGAGKFERISGRYDRAQLTQAFFDGAKPITIHSGYATLRSQDNHQTLRSPDGSWTAMLPDLAALLIIGRDKTRKVLHPASQDLCESAIIVGWVDSRYLVYRTERNAYLGDASTGKSRYLFPDSERPKLFDW
jgi:hypothetical protein